MEHLRFVGKRSHGISRKEGNVREHKRGVGPNKEQELLVQSTRPGAAPRGETTGLESGDEVIRRVRVVGRCNLGVRHVVGDEATWYENNVKGVVNPRMNMNGSPIDNCKMGLEHLAHMRSISGSSLEGEESLMSRGGDGKLAFETDLTETNRIGLSALARERVPVGVEDRVRLRPKINIACGRRAIESMGVPSDRIMKERVGL